MSKIFCGILVFFFSLSCLSYGIQSADTNIQNSEQAKALVADMLNGSLQKINVPGISDKDVKDFFEEQVKTRFALDKLVKFVLGPYFPKLTEEQKNKIFVPCFINMLVKFYTSNFKEYKKAAFKIITVRTISGGAFCIETKVLVPGKKDNVLIWIIVSTNDGFKIMDIIFENVSVRTIQKAEIRGAISSSKNGFDGFLQSFLQKYGN
ncbi:MAG: ABC transporter substrate-binding protein [Holosporaceae bacterium]|jgi:ABC-type transporter MlaC component|nr:ABC transporter substrate-binding protein [Holosporaceae bacterium]